MELIGLITVIYLLGWLFEEIYDRNNAEYIIQGEYEMWIAREKKYKN